MRARPGQTPPADPYRGNVGHAKYKRTSRFARVSLVLAKVGVLLVAMVLPFTCGAMVEEVHLGVAVGFYVTGVALLFAPAVARRRLRESDELVPEPSITEPPSDPEGVMVGGLKFMLAGFCGFVLIAAYAMLYARW